MANLLEDMLSGGQVKRQDNRHLNIAVRPLPSRPRQLFELIGALGLTATFPGLLRSVELKHADPHHIHFVALGRWPTLEEVAAMPDPYHPAPHLIGLIRGQEFRTHLVRRACEAFAERKRLLFVRIPRSGGASVLTMLDGRHPLLPLDLSAKRFDDPVLLMQTMGTVFTRTAIGNTLALAHTRMSPFLDPPIAPRNGRLLEDDPFTWGAALPPARVEDTLFTVLREPQARAFGQINALLRGWQSGERSVPPEIGARLGRPAKRLRPQDWRQLGCEILAGTLLRNPICQALGDGTAEGAVRACSRSPIQLVQLEQLNQWSRSALENMASDSVAVSEPILRRQDLGSAEVAALEEATEEDQVFYARFIKKVKEMQLPVVPGRDV